MMKDINTFQHVTVIVLCGGRSVPLGQGNSTINKALVKVRDKPLFWRVLQHYASYGASNFLMATGFQGEQFHAELLNLGAVRSSVDRFTYILLLDGNPCSVKLVSTPQEASTAQRLLACRQFLDTNHTFALTYSDTLSDVNLGAELQFHRQHRRTATLVAARPPVRFRILGIRQNETLVRAFAHKPIIENERINGGYYLFNPGIWDSMRELDLNDALEDIPLERLAAATELAAFEHNGWWQYCDAARDIEKLAQLTEKEL